MKSSKFWITLSLLNLFLAALMGFGLRTKFLFPLPFIDYKHLLSAHSHFAMGGWVTLALMVMLLHQLSRELRERKIYAIILWGIQITAMGMLVSFPFGGYTPVAIVFSTAFILVTYLFTWQYIRDIRKNPSEKSIAWAGVGAVISLAVSSVGPFTLAYLMASGSGNAFQARDAVFTFLHFQYNGFFTLALAAVLLGYIYKKLNPGQLRLYRQFVLFLLLSVAPSLFLSLLWHGYHTLDLVIAASGCVLICITIIYFTLFLRKTSGIKFFSHPWARTLLIFSIFSFYVKMILQMGTMIPSLGNAVFGFRPIIIGFLHLVFLGMVSLFIIGYIVERKIYPLQSRFAHFAILVFSGAIILNEGILLVEGIGLMFYITHPIYPTLLWIAAICLVLGALMLFLSIRKTVSQTQIPEDSI